MTGTDYGLVLFTTDKGTAPALAASIAEKHGFSSFSVPEHTHIPVNREAIHPATGDTSLPDDRYLRTLDPWASLATASAVTSRIRLSTTVALPVEHDPIEPSRNLLRPWTFCRLTGYASCRLRLEHRRTAQSRCAATAAAYGVA